MPESLASLVEASLRFLPPLVLLWLAVFFGRTLRSGAVPLIEHIARQSIPSLRPALARYTRRLTVIWCAYFLVAALLTATVSAAYAQVNLAVWAGTAVLFVGEHRLRPWFFPDEVFPGLVQQLRDTWCVWRTRG